MIGKPEWFERRKYGGWGLTPKTWQGWAYISLIILPLIIFQSMPWWSAMTRTAVTIGWIGILLADTIDITIHLKKDEREKMHEAIAERNAAWTMVAVCTAGIAYQVAMTAVQQQMMIDWWIMAILFAGVFAKMATNIYLDRTD